MSRLDLDAEIADRRWPKWSSMCQLHSLGLPVLNAIMIRPGGPPGALGAAAEALSVAAGTSHLMVRSDGGVEGRVYYRGGNTFPVEAIDREASPLLAEGRAVFLVEPTNRFDNPLTVMLRLDRSKPQTRGTLTLDALGPGYDVGDLTRGGLRPQLTVVCHGVDWSNFEDVWWSDVHVTRNLTPESEAENLVGRLDNVARHLRARGELPADPDEPSAAAELWLRRQGLSLLWSGRDATFDVLQRVRRFHADAFLLARTHWNRSWVCIACAFSILGDGRTVYWDVIDGGHKYGRRRQGAP